MQSAKRVRFKESVPDGFESGRFDAASAPCKSAGAPESNGPKTSEFAFFKKFRENSGLKHQPEFSSRGNVHLKYSKGKNYSAGECSAEYAGAKDNNTISNSSLFAENRPSETEVLLSSHVAGSRRFEHGNKKITSSSFTKTNGKNDREEDLGFLPLIKTPTSSGTDDLIMERATEPVRSDTYYTDGDLFSKKRANLQSLVAKTMFTGTGENARGCDLIALLLNRLEPESFDINDSDALKARHNEEDTEYDPDFMLKPGYQLKKIWNGRTLVKHEDPYFMDVGASSSRSKEFYGSFQSERSARSGFPALDYVDKMVREHQDRELEPCYFSSIHHKQSWSNNSAETFLKENAEHFETSGTFNCRRMALADESFQEHPWNVYPSDTRHYRLDSTLSAQESFFGNADSSIPYINKNDNRFLLEYEKREPGPLLSHSRGVYRSSSLESVIGADESNHELEYMSFGRRPSDLLLGWESDEPKEYKKRHSFPSNALMHYRQTPEISEVEDVFLESDSKYTHPYEFIPADNSGFLLPSSHQFLLPQLEAPETAHPSHYLLSEGVEDEYEQNPWIKKICYHSDTSISRSPELIEPSQVLKLHWRDTDEEDAYIL